MILYVDTSSLVKLYLEEDHSDSMRELVAAADAVATSRVAYAEALSAFARRRQEGDLSDDDFDLVCEAFDAQWPRLVLIPVKERPDGWPFGTCCVASTPSILPPRWILSAR